MFLSVRKRFTVVEHRLSRSTLQFTGLKALYHVLAKKCDSSIRFHEPFDCQKDNAKHRPSNIHHDTQLNK